MKRPVKTFLFGVHQHIWFYMLVLIIITLFYVDAFGTDAEKFSLFFKRVIRLLTDAELSLLLSRSVLIFMIHCFQSLENDLVRTECLKLVTIGIWSHLAHQGKREEFLVDYPNLQKLWNSSNKKMVAAGKEDKSTSHADYLISYRRAYQRTNGIRKNLAKQLDEKVY